MSEWTVFSVDLEHNVSDGLINQTFLKIQVQALCVLALANFH